MNQSNVDKILLERIVTEVEKKFAYLQNNIDQIYTVDYIEDIISNIIRSKVHAIVIEKVNDILNMQMWNMVDHAINEDEQLYIVINHEVSKFIASRDFVNMLQDNLRWHMQKKLTGEKYD